MSSLKILVLSDLHVEFGGFVLSQGEADVVVLAGDIWTGARGVAWVRESTIACPVIYVAGNHEAYGQCFPKHLDKLREAAANSRVQFLENDAVVIKGVTFHGATLWTDFALHNNPKFDAFNAQQQLNDYKKIRIFDRDRYRALTPIDTKRWHEQSLSWLASSLKNSTTQRNVIVSHHAPSQRSVHPVHLNDALSAAYASNLEHFVEQHQPDLWIHGHMHHSNNYRLGKTRIVSNPRGYAGHELNPMFDPLCYVEV